MLEHQVGSQIDSLLIGCHRFVKAYAAGQAAEQQLRRRSLQKVRTGCLDGTSWPERIIPGDGSGPFLR